MRQFRSILQSADLLGRYRHVELRCFEVVGARALRASEPRAAVLLDAASAAHAWRAREIEVRLPVSLGLPGVEEATRAPSPELDDALGALGADEDDDAVLGALSSVLYPAIIDAYRQHLASTMPSADAPIARMLRRVLADAEATALELGDGHAAHGRAARDLATAIRASGGVFGGP